MPFDTPRVAACCWGVRRDGGDRVRLCVHDTGRGIAKADMARIFREFERGPSTDREGLGLGLAIVTRTSALLDTQVQATSMPDRGSGFSFSLPALRWGGAMSTETVPSPARAIREARALVVDNDAAVLTATSALLARWGLDAICATSLASALDISPQAPDIVIMDYRLNGNERGDSVYGELCMVWKSQPPAILLTAEDSEETDFAALAMGANRLLKPSSPAALRALISTCLARPAAPLARGGGRQPQTPTEPVAG